KHALLADALGSILALVNSSGAVQASYRYEPFGRATLTGNDDGNSLQYSGRENDGTGLMYFRARYYHAALGRFISEDPIEYAAGDVNRYVYALNAPTNFIDPFGLTCGRKDSGEEIKDAVRKLLDDYKDAYMQAI